MPMHPNSLANLRQGGGRPGMPTRVPLNIREDVLEAGSRYRGVQRADGSWLYEPGMVGYLESLRDERPDLFASLIRASMPRDVKIDATVSISLATLLEQSRAVPRERVEEIAAARNGHNEIPTENTT